MRYSQSASARKAQALPPANAPSMSSTKAALPPQPGLAVRALLLLLWLALLLSHLASGRLSIAQTPLTARSQRHKSPAL